MRWILAVAVVVGSCWTILNAYAADRSPQSVAAAAKLDAREEHDFGAKVIVIYTRHESSHPTYVSQGAIQRLGDRLFIAGKYPRFPGHEYAWDLPVWSPLSEVTEIVEFDSLEKAVKALHSQEQGLPQSLDPTRDPS